MLVYQLGLVLVLNDRKYNNNSLNQIDVYYFFLLYQVVRSFELLWWFFKYQGFRCFYFIVMLILVWEEVMKSFVFFILRMFLRV